jgi:hypothetical protein
MKVGAKQKSHFFGARVLMSNKSENLRYLRARYKFRLVRVEKEVIEIKQIKFAGSISINISLMHNIRIFKWKLP